MKKSICNFNDNAISRHKKLPKLEWQQHAQTLQGEAGLGDAFGAEPVCTITDKYSALPNWTWNIH